MSECGPVLPCLARARNIAAVALAASAIGVSAAEPALALRPTAREYAPGEPVRFLATSGTGVQAVQGEFLGAPLDFVPSGRGEGSVDWIAWGVVPLDAKPQAASYRVRATPGDGAGSIAVGEIDIVAKAFPEQRLTVESKFVNPPKSALARIERERKKLAVIYARRSGYPPPAQPFVRPVPGDPTSEFGTRRIFNDEPRSPHPGIDLRAAAGTPVLASGPGRVALAEDLYYSGGTVIVDHGGGLFTVYAHLSKIETKSGAEVSAGDRIALSGATGRVTGPHLHWGAKVGDAIFDPRALLDPRLFGL